MRCFTCTRLELKRVRIAHVIQTGHMWLVAIILEVQFKDTLYPPQTPF